MAIRMAIRYVRRIAPLLFFLLGSFHVFSQEMLWGMTSGGGNTNSGVIFKTNEDGTGLEVIKSFNVTPGGSTLYNKLIQAADGKLYGMTRGGGWYGKGILFEYDITNNSYTVKVDFDGINNGAYPQGSLVEAYNGKLYGMTSEGGANGVGVLFEFDPASDSYSKKFDFSNLSGTQPSGDLIQVADGSLWGVTSGGGGIGRGVLFRFDPVTNAYVKKKEFDSPVGVRPFGSLLMVSGKLYGMNMFGGMHDRGTIYEYDTATNIITVKFNFSGNSDGAYPIGTLIDGADGKLYGVTPTGTSHIRGEQTIFYGSLFHFSPSTGVFARMQSTEGLYGDLFQASDGNLYGMTDLYTYSKFYKVNMSTGNLSAIISYEDPLKGGPSRSALMQASNGKLYGMTSQGGTGLAGVLFEYDPVTGDYNVKVNFGENTDGTSPLGHFVQGLNGKLYGITSEGGANGLGVLFEYDITNSIFTKKLDLASGNSSVSGMMPASNGKLYGLAKYRYSGNEGGELFEYDPSNNQYVKKVDFGLINTGWPIGTLTQLPNGKMYGVTHGDYGIRGVLFEYDAATNILAKKIEFDFNGTKGLYPSGSLLYSDGKLFGLTEQGGANNKGILFEFDPDSGVFSKKVDFDGSVTGAIPVGALIKARNNKLYGVAQSGGSFNAGVIFEYDPLEGNFVKKIDFTGNPADGLNVKGGFAESSNGKLYATTINGGSDGKGVLFEYDITDNVITTKQHFTDANGAYPYYGPLLYVSMKNQTITFNTLQEKVYNDMPFALNASTTSGLSITYTSSNPDVATIVDNMVTINGAGTTMITASQKGSPNFHPSAVAQALTVNKCNQTIIFYALPDKNVNDMPFDLNASATSALAIAYSSSNFSVATIEGKTLTIIGPGTSVITATQSGNNNYFPAIEVSQIQRINVVLSVEDQSDHDITIYPNPANQEITFELNNVKSINQIDNIKFYNSIGRSLTVPLQSTTETGKYRCDTSELAEGLYYLILPGNGAKAIMIIH